MSEKRDHGGGLDAAVARYGGTRAEWLDLSTGINSVPYPVGEISADAWTALPDSGAMDRLLAAARRFWNVPDGAEIVAANGASAIIAGLPNAMGYSGAVYIPQPTYNEHAAAFENARGTEVVDHPSKYAEDDRDRAYMDVYVHPNNPTGQIWSDDDISRTRLTIVDESFCDVTPDVSHIERTDESRKIVLKSFGKFWGLAGLRIGFAIGAREQHRFFDVAWTAHQKKTPHWSKALKNHLGPWSVSGPALEIGARALEDVAWAEATRARLAGDAARLDDLVGWDLVGGTDLFRTYEVPDAAAMQDKLARGKVWSRIFPYSKTWIRLGLPAPDGWDQLRAALA